MNPKKHVDIIFFDFDGTLVNTPPDIIRGVQYTLKTLKLKKKSSQEIQSYIGRGQRYLIKKALGGRYQFLLNKALNIFDAYYVHHCYDASRIYPTVKSTLKYFKNKINVIITNKNSYFVQKGLKHFKIEKYFKELICGDTSAYLKPSPYPIKKMLKKYCIESRKALMIGDMDIDIITGRKAGILTCGVTYGLGSIKTLKKARPDYCINCLSELKKFII